MELSKPVENSFWDIKDLSVYLKVKIKTLYAQLPEIPHYRVGKLIRFRKQEIDSWMDQNRGMVIGRSNKPANKHTSRLRKGNANIDKLIRKAIDQSRDEVYTPDHGKSDRIKGPKEEINHGSI